MSHGPSVLRRRQYRGSTFVATAERMCEGTWPPAVRLALFNGVVTASMTRIVMPQTARLLQRWLDPSRAHE